MCTFDILRCDKCSLYLQCFEKKEKKKEERKQAAFEKGYQQALKDIENRKNQNPNREMEDILYELDHYATPVFVSKGRWKVINSKYSRGYQKALDDERAKLEKRGGD